jgi:hypothetical protein
MAARERIRIKYLLGLGKWETTALATELFPVPPSPVPVTKALVCKVLNWDHVCDLKWLQDLLLPINDQKSYETWWTFHPRVEKVLISLNKHKGRMGHKVTLLHEYMPMSHISLYSETFFFSCGTGAWAQGLYLEPLYQSFFCEGLFTIGSCRTICPG